MRKGLPLTTPIILTILIISLISFTLNIQSVKAEQDYIDNFDSTTLKANWTVIDPAGGSTFDLTANSGWLRITAPSGRDLLPVKFNAPKIAQAVAGDFIAETKISANTDENDEGAGILLWKDSNTYVRLERMSRTIGNPVQQQILFGGSVNSIWPCPGDTHVVLNSNINPTYLRLAKSGNILSGWYSADGTIWNSLGNIPFAISSQVNIGLAVVNEYHTGNFYADFDYFKISPANSIAPISGQSSNSGLIADWNFNEGTGSIVLDSSGKNYQGTIHGATWAGSQGNYALKFNGVSDFVDVPSLPVSNINSLTVIAWINSDLTKTGYIFYHGDTGEFLLHNGERLSDGPVAGRYPNLASFSVKLAGSTWHDVYSQPLEPNVWHQIVGVWTKGASLKIYVDGALAGENNNIASGYLLNDGPTWLPSFGVYNRGAGADDYFKGMLDNVMVYGRALSNQEISTLYTNTEVAVSPTPSPTSAPSQNPKPNLNITCKSSATQSGLKVEIMGSLTGNGLALSGLPVLISYSVNRGSSWNELTTIDTAGDGGFFAVWYPSVTGNYMVKAAFNGNNAYSGTATEVNFAVTPYKEESTFSVTSNSTLSQLAFNSTSNQLTFTVNGESGTKGYVNAYIPKSLISDISTLKVHLDENQINYLTESQSDSWLLYFTYQHSTHNIAITLNPITNQSNDLLGNWLYYGVAIAIIVIAIGLVLIVRKRKTG